MLVSTGNEYRKIISQPGYSSDLIKKIINAGGLQPDFLTNSLFASTLLREITPDKNLIADGFPRSIGQSIAFDQAKKFYSRGEVVIIYIKLSKEEATKRMKLRGRADDTDEGIAQRFHEYETNVLPSLEFFRGKPGYTIHEINGEQSIEDVHKEIIAKLGL